MLEKTRREVKSVAAKREIHLAITSIRVLRAELKTAMINDEAVKDAVKLADRHGHLELSAKLQAMLEVDLETDQDDYRIEPVKGGKWKASVVLRGKTYKLGSYSDTQEAVDVIKEFTLAFKNSGD